MHDPSDDPPEQIELVSVKDGWEWVSPSYKDEGEPRHRTRYVRADHAQPKIVRVGGPDDVVDLHTVHRLREELAAARTKIDTLVLQLGLARDRFLSIGSDANAALASAKHGYKSIVEFEKSKS